MKAVLERLKSFVNKYYRLADIPEVDLEKYQDIRDVELSFSHVKEKGGARFVSLCSIILFSCIIFGLSAAFIILPDKDFSENENRRLKQFPKFSAEEIINRNFTRQIGDYYADQFPARPTFVTLKAATETALWRGENKGVLLGKDSWLIPRADIYDSISDDMDTSYTKEEMYAMMQDNLYAASMLADALDIPVYFAPVPRKLDIMRKEYPTFFSPQRHDEHYQRLEELMDAAGLTSVNLKFALAGHDGEYIYYKTDHHWTTLGAYYAYREIMESLGEIPLEASSFNKEVLSTQFYGTSWSKSGTSWIAPDTMELWSTEKSFIMDIMGKKLLEGFIDSDYLNVKDKYSAYIGGISGGTKIRLKDGEEREKLLLICDSYGQSLAPFLAQHFDVDVIDMRYFKSSMKKYVEDNGISRMVILNGVEGLMTQRTLVSLSLGLG